MGTRNPGYTEDPYCHGDISMRQITNVYANDTPVIDPPFSYHREPQDHTYLAPRLTGYNTDDVIGRCKKENVYDALGRYREEHSAEAMRKKNVCYEESTQFRKRPIQPKSFRPKQRRKSSGCCIPFVLFFFGIISLGALAVTLLQYFGILACIGAASTTGEFRGRQYQKLLLSRAKS